jgi:hypothetical protein
LFSINYFRKKKKKAHTRETVTCRPVEPGSPHGCARAAAGREESLDDV